MRLTVKSTADAKLPTGTTDTVFWDDDIAGFGLRIRKGGSRAWIYRYRIGNQQRSITLGNAKSVPLALARANAGQLEAKVRLGSDPAKDKETARIEANSTLGPLVNQYLDERKAEWRPNSLRQVRHHLLVHAKPLHRLPIGAVSQRSISSLLADIAKEHPVTSNRVRASLSTFLSWVIRQGIKLPEGNVASYTQPRKEKSRERVLTDAEIGAVWHACRKDDHGNIVKLLLLTGQRQAEIGSLRWDEVQGSQIILPGERTKNKRPHIVPLSAPAAAILDRLRVVDRTLVFGRDDSHGFGGWGKSKKQLDKRIANGGAPIPHWTLHDLRRTAATGMIGLGIEPHHVEAVLNHVSGHRAGVAGIYNRSAYSAEKREALNLWAEHVLAIVGA
jgi:integrase